MNEYADYAHTFYSLLLKSNVSMLNSCYSLRIGSNIKYCLKNRFRRGGIKFSHCYHTISPSSTTLNQIRFHRSNCHFPIQQNIRTISYIKRVSSNVSKLSKSTSFSPLNKPEDENIEMEISTASDKPSLFSNSSLSFPLVPPNFPTYLHHHTINLTPLPRSSPSFNDLKISSHICHQLELFGMNSPTLIQTAAIPFLNRRIPPLPSLIHLSSSTPAIAFPDVLLQDIPGDGKTLAYLLPMLSQCSPYLSALQAVILTPTRQLSHQIYNIIQEIQKGGNKNRSKHKLRVDLAVGKSNPSLEEQICKPLPQSTSLQHSNSPYPHIIIGTLECVHTLLLQKRLLDTSHIKYIILDEIDTLLSRAESRPFILPIISLRSHLPNHLAVEANQFIENDKQSYNNQTNQLNNPSDSNIKRDNIYKEIHSHARTQIVFVSSTLNPGVLVFAEQHLPFRVVITPASVPSETIRKNRRLLSATFNQRNQLRMSLLPTLPSGVTHHYLYVYSPVSRNKPNVLADMLIALYRQHNSLDRRKVGVRRRELRNSPTSLLKSGLTAVRPTQIPPQTIIVLFSYAEDIYPILPTLSTLPLRLSLLTPRSSRHEISKSLNQDDPPDVLLCESSCMRGIDLKSARVVINWGVPISGVSSGGGEIEYLHRAGLVGRRGQIYSNRSIVITLLLKQSGRIGQQKTKQQKSKEHNPFLSIASAEKPLSVSSLSKTSTTTRTIREDKNHEDSNPLIKSASGDVDDNINDDKSRLEFIMDRLGGIRMSELMLKDEDLVELKSEQEEKNNPDNEVRDKGGKLIKLLNYSKYKESNVKGIPMIRSTIQSQDITISKPRKHNSFLSHLIGEGESEGDQNKERKRKKKKYSTLQS